MSMTIKCQMCNQPILEQTLKGKKIAIDVGHGWSVTSIFDVGATGNGRTEYEINSIVAKKTSEILKSLGADVFVFDYAPETSERLTLNAKGRKAGTVKADCFVSIHHNAFNGSAQGTEVLVHSLATDEDRKLAQCIHKQMVDKLKLIDRGVKDQQLGVLRGCPVEIPACLSEAFFIDAFSLKGKIPDSLLADEALGLALGIRDYLLS